MDYQTYDRIRRLDRTRRASEETGDTDLIVAPTIGELVPKLSRGWSNPVHLAPLADVLERAPHGRLRVVFSAPPRFGKTELVSHAIPHWLARDPSLEIIYLTYSQGLAFSKSRHMRSLARRAGIRLGSDTRGKGEWLTVEEGGMRAAGIDGGVTGQGAGILLLDDLHKDRSEAESASRRDHVWTQVTNAVNTRLTPDGSAILYMQRWNDDDAAARAIALGWTWINLPAIDSETGESLWPERWSLADLLAKKAPMTPYEWASQYEGNPQPRSGRVFPDPILGELVDAPSYGPTAGGTDLAHTATTRSDFQACVTITLDPKTQLFWIRDIRNRRAKLVLREGESGERGFVDELGEVRESFPGIRFGMYAARQENALIDVIGATTGLYIEQRKVISDKFQRSLPFAHACEQGRVRIVKGIKNIDAFVAQMASFTGRGDAHDDMIDAAACAYDMLCEGAGLSVLTPSMNASYREPGATRRSSSGRKLYT
jgi:phage terminase large subunit-like protein